MSQKSRAYDPTPWIPACAGMVAARRAPVVSTCALNTFGYGARL